jgi:hypothetical protein
VKTPVLGHAASRDASQCAFAAREAEHDVVFALPDLRSLRFHMAWAAGLFIARLPDAPGSGKMFRLFRW